MLARQIQTWLHEQGGYLPGLALLGQTDNRKTYRRLEVYITYPLIPATAYAELTNALRAYLVAHPPPPETKTAPPSYRTPAAPPEPAHPLRDKAKTLLRERDAYRAQLNQMVREREKYTEADRGELAHLIMSVQQEIDDAYQRLRTYEETGELPDTGSAYAIQQATIAKMNRMSSLRSAISRHVKRLKNPPSEVKKQEWEADLLAKRVELKDLARELNLEE